MSTAHHMLLYGCLVPGGEEGGVWSCGEMLAQNSGVANGPVCAEGSQIVYAWAMDAPSLTLPKGRDKLVHANSKLLIVFGKK